MRVHSIKNSIQLTKRSKFGKDIYVIRRKDKRMSDEEMIKILKSKGYQVYEPLSEKQLKDADACVGSEYGDCIYCSCYVCLAGIE